MRSKNTSTNIKNATSRQSLRASVLTRKCLGSSILSDQKSREAADIVRLLKKLISMAGLIFVETSLKAKAHVIRCMICFALTRLECRYEQVLKQMRLNPSG
ncbi:MAG TPA: hypothetical protein DEG78_00015 [Rhodobacteraceae bacterium]|jgi:hypothetical protein|nr:hypothetical protein [Paracoccaceae bacterium]